MPAAPGLAAGAEHGLGGGGEGVTPSVEWPMVGGEPINEDFAEKLEAWLLEKVDQFQDDLKAFGQPLQDELEHLREVDPAKAAKLKALTDELRPIINMLLGAANTFKANIAGFIADDGRIDLGEARSIAGELKRFISLYNQYLRIMGQIGELAPKVIPTQEA